MNQSEFDQFKNRLFVAYPSLYEWLTEKSIDPKATLRSWYRRLERYTLAECESVLDRWESQNAEPWKAYERDQVPSIIGSVIAADRDRQNREKFTNDSRKQYEDAKRQKQESLVGGFAAIQSDSQMSKAFEALKPLHKKHMEGGLSSLEYQVKKTEIFEECGLNSTTEAKAEAWQP